MNDVIGVSQVRICCFVPNDEMNTPMPRVVPPAPLLPAGGAPRECWDSEVQLGFKWLFSSERSGR